jgi:hypothetical protein
VVNVTARPEPLIVMPAAEALSDSDLRGDFAWETNKPRGRPKSSARAPALAALLTLVGIGLGGWWLLNPSPTRVSRGNTSFSAPIEVAPPAAGLATSPASGVAAAPASSGAARGPAATADAGATAAPAAAAVTTAPAAVATVAAAPSAVVPSAVVPSASAAMSLAAAPSPAPAPPVASPPALEPVVTAAAAPPEAKPSKSAAKETAKAASTKTSAKRPDDAAPRDDCSGRTNFSLYYCMQKQCTLPQFKAHAQCKLLREKDIVD